MKVTVNIEAHNWCTDACKHCGAQIRYDKEDCYWDSVHDEKNGMTTYTPYCGDDDSHQLHEPVNYERGRHGLYFERDPLQL